MMALTQGLEWPGLVPGMTLEVDRQQRFLHNILEI
jgi:hypothetical protein